MINSLSRFVEAQENSYERALAEIRQGKKQSHWMWFIFPQIKGLGRSEVSKRYAIENLAEAQEYLGHPLLGPRLIWICDALLMLNENNATRIFGSPDDVKLKSSMTLFDTIKKSNPVFLMVLEKFFGGEKDSATLEILGRG